MYTLYYLNKNLQIATIKVPHLNSAVNIPEDLIFCNLRKGINFIKEPNSCIQFTDTERLIMSSEFTDSSLIKESDYRKQNTMLDIMCQVDMELPFLDVTVFDFSSYANLDEGHEGLTFYFSPYFDLSKVKLCFTDGVERIYTRPLNYYLMVNPVYADSTLKTFDEGYTYHLYYWQIAELQNALGLTKKFRAVYFVHVNDEVDYGRNSLPYSLRNLLQSSTITSYNAGTHAINFDWYEELIAVGTAFKIKVENYFHHEKHLGDIDSTMNSYSAYTGVVSGDIITIYDPTGYWGRSNTFIVP